MKKRDKIQNSRLRTVLITGGAMYVGASYALYKAWYAGEDLGNFHTHNDWSEWQQMDKAGHLFSTWLESYYAYRGLEWAGMERDKAIWYGAGTGMLFQTTFEVMDGFSNKWGFSWSDMAFNALGAGAFVFQEKQWGEQRITFKVSSVYRDYPAMPELTGSGGSRMSLVERADNLYGASLPERILKDYNAQTIWASVNLHSFLPEDNAWPAWLNVAIGYGAENMYGGFDNSWEYQGEEFTYGEDRYRQFFLSPDLDLRKIHTESKFLRTALDILNLIKFPAPALEVNGKGKLSGHWIYF